MESAFALRGAFALREFSLLRSSPEASGPFVCAYEIRLDLVLITVTPLVSTSCYYPFYDIGGSELSSHSSTF